MTPWVIWPSSSQGGAEGRGRTEISRDHFKGNAKAADISAALAPLIHDGTVLQVTEERPVGRPLTRYLHCTVRKNVFTKCAGKSDIQSWYGTNLRTESSRQTIVNSSQFVDGPSPKIGPELQSSSDSLIRGSEGTNGDTEPHGAMTAAGLQVLLAAGLDGPGPDGTLPTGAIQALLDADLDMHGELLPWIKPQSKGTEI